MGEAQCYQILYSLVLSHLLAKTTLEDPHWKYAKKFGILIPIVMKYAVIQTGGKQYRVSEGDSLEVERLTTSPTEKIVFNDVLLMVADGDIKVGTPYVSGLSVIAEVVAQVKGEKIRVSKFKAKARYRRTTGHRQSLSKIQILQIGDKKEVKTEKAPQEVTPKASQKIVKKPTHVVKKKTV